MKHKKTNIVVMINGKTRGSIPVYTDSTETSVRQRVMKLNAVREFTATNSIHKVVYIPNRFINFVI